MENENEWDGQTGSKLDFGARIYDSRIARFLSADPKRNDYPYWSPYLFAANSPIIFVDINGEGPGDLFEKEEEAAIDWGNTYNSKSILKDREFGSKIYRIRKDGQYYYTYNKPRIGKIDEVVVRDRMFFKMFSKKEMTAGIHSHGAWKKDKVTKEGIDGNNSFSPGDYVGTILNKRPLYLVSPDGCLRYYKEGIQNEEVPIYKGFPSDPKDPSNTESIDKDKTDPSNKSETESTDEEKNKPNVNENKDEKQ